MSGDANTNRPVSAAVYRRRRLVVFGGLIAVVLVIVLIVVRPFGGGDDGDDGDTADPVASPSGSVSEQADDEADGEASEPAEGEAVDPAGMPCAGTALQVAAITDATVYPDGVSPQLTLSVTNTSQTACLLDASTDNQQFLVTSGPEQIWLSTHCAGEPQQAEVVLEAGQQISSGTPLAWNRTRSVEGDCEGGSTVLPGYYNLEVTIAGVTSPEARQFELQ